MQMLNRVKVSSILTNQHGAYLLSAPVTALSAFEAPPSPPALPQAAPADVGRRWSLTVPICGSPSHEG